MLAIDWGSSSLRIYRMNAKGGVSETRQSGDGILKVADRAFAAALEDRAGDWITAGEDPIIMSGMIGSRQGWMEAAYVACPAGLADIASAMCTVQWNSAKGEVRSGWIAPGLRCLDQAGVNDVMRGEEVQILGIIDQLGPGEHHVCLPGTHSKWVVVRDHLITSFSTCMTGELFAVLKRHSILARTMARDHFEQTGFINGVARANDPGGLLHHLFGVRAQVLAGQIADDQSASYLSGILIGHELRSVPSGINRFHLVGDAELAALYSLAASEMGMSATVHDTGAAPRGLFALAQYRKDDM